MEKKQYLDLKKELDCIVKEVVEKKDRLVPIIGDECFVGNKDVEQVFVPLQQWLAEKLLGEKISKQLKKKIFLGGYHGLDLLRDEYERKFQKRRFKGNYEGAIKEIIDKGIEDGSLHLRKDVKDFLIAGQFEVVITTCPFNILDKEIKYGGRQYKVSSFSPKLSSPEATLGLPAIYQLFGNIRYDYVSGERKLLEFLHSLNHSHTENGYGASALVKYLEDKKADNNGLALLMPIGCNNLPNWIFRFLWYPFCLDPSCGSGNLQGGIWCKHSSDEDFYDFLVDYGFMTFSKPTDLLGDEGIAGDPVLVQLAKVLQDKDKKIKDYISSTLQVPCSTDGEYDIFISYSSGDCEFVKRIYEILSKYCGKKVWMDSRIKGGEVYWDAIQYGIEHSHKYLFVITKSYLQKAVGKNVEDPITHELGPTGVYGEIDKIRLNILNKRKDGEKNNVIPLIYRSDDEEKNTIVTYTDNSGKLHKNEELTQTVLEKLPFVKEYQMMQTQDLFKGIQAVKCDYDNLKEELMKIFNS